MQVKKKKAMNQNFRIFPEEHPCNEDEIEKVEKIIGIRFPNDYRNFLLKYNGGVIRPNLPKDPKVEFLPIERFYSIGDIYQQQVSNICYSGYVDIRHHESHIEEIEKYVTIGKCDQGVILICCGKSDYSRIYYCKYDGIGFVRTSFDSFTSLINSVDFYDDKYDLSEINIDDDYFIKKKIFDYYFFNNKENPNLGVKRFKEVLEFYGDPNKNVKYRGSLTDEYHPESEFGKLIIEKGGIYEELK